MIFKTSKVIFFLSIFVDGFFSLTAFLPRYYPTATGISNKWNPQKPGISRRFYLLQASTYNLDEEIDPQSNLSESTDIVSDTEFWLDLRDTALTPQDALSYLYRELASDCSMYGWKLRRTEKGDEDYDATSIDPDIIIPDLIHRIMLNDNTFVKKKNKRESILFQDLDLIFHSSDTNLLHLETNVSSENMSTESSFCFGRSLQISPSSDDTMMHPMTAMDCLSSQQWVLLDSANNLSFGDETERMSKVSDLIQFLSFSNNDDLAASSSGLILTSSSTNKEVSDPSTQGGVAVVCKSRSDLLIAGQALQQYQFSTSLSSSQSILTSESGIAFVQDSSDNGDVKIKNPSKTAMVLPFDASLWKTVAFLYGQSLFSHDEEA